MTNSLSLSSVFNVYSMRERTPNNAGESLTSELRNRVRLFCKEIVHPYEHESLVGYRISDYWATLRDKLRYSLGRVHLVDTQQPTVIMEVEAFLTECSDEHYLDFIEMFFHSNLLPAYFSDSELQDAVTNINEFFDVDELPYRLTKFVIDRSPENSERVLVNSPLNHKSELLEKRTPGYVAVPKVEAYPQIIRSDNEILQKTAIQPALELLANPAFSSANREFLEALSDYRKKDYGDCVVKCGSAFESVMKIICKQKDWPVNGEAAKLLNTVLRKTELPPFLKQPLILIATIRNELGSAHGAGTQPRRVTQHLARYTINLTASAIVLLVEETRP